jgi:hypothetical protein
LAWQVLSKHGVDSLVLWLYNTYSKGENMQALINLGIVMLPIVVMALAIVIKDGF